MHFSHWIKCILHFGSVRYGCEYHTIIRSYDFTYYLFYCSNARFFFFVFSRNGSQVQCRLNVNSVWYTAIHTLTFPTSEFLSNVEWRSMCANFTQLSYFICTSSSKQCHNHNSKNKKKKQIITSLLWSDSVASCSLSLSLPIFLENFLHFHFTPV